MLDFLLIEDQSGKVRGSVDIVPDFAVKPGNDLLIRGGAFYGIWDEATGLWSKNEFDVQRLVDAELYSYSEEYKRKNPDTIVRVKSMSKYSNGSWSKYKKYVKEIGDTHHVLDDKIVFNNTKVSKTDYISRRLKYDLEAGDISAYDELMSTLYNPEEREKLEWAIGSIVSGESRYIQKFIVLYGEAGSGKSTVLNIIQEMFEGYCVSFDAKSLGNSNNTFATECFRGNPLVAIQHDGDLSRIEDNTKLNSIVSHEMMPMHEKYKATYDARCNAFLFMGTNKPVKITDAKSGLIRRLIDVSPSGKKVKPRRYNELMHQIGFELGATAYHCLNVFNDLGRDYYSAYRPVGMMFKTDSFFNYVEYCYDDYSKEDGVSLRRAYSKYKEYCDEALITTRLQMYKFREELKNYFSEFYDRTIVDGEEVRSYYKGFIGTKFAYSTEPKKEEPPTEESWLNLKNIPSLFDELYSDCPAQYTTQNETPKQPWAKVTSKLKDIMTSDLHYVKTPENHIVIDFDLKDADGNKSLKLNLDAASKWPKTYAETSKGGQGLHLSYIYDGDVTKLANSYAEHIEVKVFTGGSALRRRLTLCNDIPVAHISSGLPLKEEKKSSMINATAVKSEMGLRKLIDRALRKEIHPNTKPSIDFIEKVLADAYASGLQYDVNNLRQSVVIFALGSTNNADYCLKRIKNMKFASEDNVQAERNVVEGTSEAPIVFYDCEVFPNLLLINYKVAGEGNPVCSVKNPKPDWLERFFKYRLIGFNCRNYDNHILYAAYMGYSNRQIYEVSKGIVEGRPGFKFGQAYNISYTDVYDFSSKKQSLKKFEIELGIHHQELGFRWDEPVPEDKWDLVSKYCDNDVIATEAVFNARKDDWQARLILADIAGMTPNDTTNSLTTKIVFEGNKKPQSEFNYRDLGGPKDIPLEGPDFTRYPGTDPNYTVFYKGKAIFPGYKFDAGKSTYRGIEPGEGGYAKGKPGIYRNVICLDIAGMHPATMRAEVMFGKHYTDNFGMLVDIRLHIKHKDYEPIRQMFDGRLSKYLTSDDQAKGLSKALKIAVNSAYGLTSAKFDNPFRDIRNKDNLVAKRGALFMINLINEVEARGYNVIHVKTDSIKIANYDKDIVDFVTWYGSLYGYTFEVEAVYDRICLVNDAVYIAKYRDDDPDTDHLKHGGWTATGAEFAHPYIFKKLFSHEDIVFSDMCETKSSTSAIYLDMNEFLEEDQHNYVFVGKVGLFTPIRSGRGGGQLMREKDGKYYSVGGTKGYRWLESETVSLMNREGDIDISYYDAMVEEAAKHISQYGDVDDFTGIPRTCDDCPNKGNCTCEEDKE